MKQSDISNTKNEEKTFLRHGTHPFWQNKPGLLLKTLLIFFILQSIYWAVYIPLNKPSKPPLDSVITEFEYALIDAPTLEATQTANFETFTTPWRKDIDAPYYIAIKGQLEIPENLTADIGIGFSVNVDNHYIYVNGHPILQNGRITHPATHHAFKREIIKISGSLMHSGTNEILFLAAKNKVPGIIVGPVFIGDYEGIMQATSRKRFLFGDFRKLTIVIATLIAFLSLLMLPQTQNKASALWLALLAGAIAMRTIFYFYFGTFGGEYARVLIYFAATNLIALAWFNYCDAWSSGNKRLRWAAVTIYMILMAIITGLLLHNFGKGFERAEHLTDWFTFASASSTLMRLGWGIFRHREERIWEAAALAVGVSLTLWDTIGFIFIGVDAGHQRIAAPIILFALVAASLSRNLKIYESIGAFNAQLEDTLKEREGEIKSKYKELEVTRRQRDISDERQRILRDMHDGIGAQLVVLLSAARAGELEQKALETAISQTLTDLRLMIDSLDSVSSDFAIALGTFRSRIMPTLTSAGYTLHWNLDNLPIGITLAPRTVLNIYRILQEAIANVLRHAEADEISITVHATTGATTPSYDIEILDNGKNVEPSHVSSTDHAGQGLKSMNRRAEDIGAKINFETTNKGFIVHLKGIKPTSLIP